MKFSIKDFFSKCDQTCSFLRIWSHLLKKSLTKLYFFVKCYLFRCLIVLRSFSNQFCDYKLEARKSSLIFQAWNLSGFSTISFKGNQSMTFSDSFGLQELSYQHYLTRLQLRCRRQNLGAVRLL